jgi:hypothetical protein
MIPDFDEQGNLPPGVHDADSIQELNQKFGQNEHRKKLIEGLIRVLKNLQAAGCEEAFVNGSFATNKDHPKDYDGCWNKRGVDIKKLDPLLLMDDQKRSGQKAKYFGEFFIADSKANSAGDVFLNFFQADRDGVKKGIIRIDLKRIAL